MFSVYVAFFIADSELGLSAVLAIVVMGLYMAKHRYAVSPSVQPNLTAVWNLLIFAVNIFIFVLSGLIISAKIINSSVRGVDVAYLFILYLLLHVVRFLSVVLFLPLFRRSNVHLSMREVVMISWSGMRGGVSLLLALITYLQPAYDPVFRERLTFQVCGIVLLTLVVNGVSSRYVLQALQLHTGSPESRLVLRSALEHMRIQTAAAMREMRVDAKFQAVEWTILRPFLPATLISEVQQRDELMLEEEKAALLQRKLERRLDQRSQSKAALPMEGTEEAGAEGKSPPRRGESMELAELRDLIFPPSHPIHRMALSADDDQREEKGSEPPGDLTLMNMSTLQFQQQRNRSTAPLTQTGVDGEQAEHAEVGDEGNGEEELPPRVAVHSATVGSGGDLRPPSMTRRLSRPLLASPPPRLPPRSSLMALFEEVDEEKEVEGAVAGLEERPLSPSNGSLAMGTEPSHPPAGPAAPGPPPPLLPSSPSPPPFRPPPLLRTATPHSSPPPPRPSRSRVRWPPPLKSTASHRLLASLQPPTRIPPVMSPRSRRRRYLLQHSRAHQMSSVGELRLRAEGQSHVDVAKQRLNRELSVRFLTACLTDYNRQFASGLVTRRSLRILTAACESGMDHGSLMSANNNTTQHSATTRLHHPPNGQS